MEPGLHRLRYDEEYKARFRHTDPDGRRWTDYDLTAKGLSGGGYLYEYKGVKSLWRVPMETMKRLDAEGRLHFTKRGGIRLKRYLDELPGIPIQDVIVDIPPLNSQAIERLGYPTQKPVPLLQRIIQASSNKDDIVLDPFCGCGTALVAAESLQRRWIGIDITHLAISLIHYQLSRFFGDSLAPYEVFGLPKDLAGARALAEQDRHQFELWALSLVEAFPFQEKRGADTGIDGYIKFFDDNSGCAKEIIVQVKSGHVGVRHVRELEGVLEREQAPIGVLITLEEPTKPMLIEAAAAGFYEPEYLPGKRYPRLQILTIKDLLAGRKVEHPRLGPPATFKRAPRRHKGEPPKQGELPLKYA